MGANMDLDEVLGRLGRFGRWQTITYIILGFSFGLSTSWQLFAIVFIGYYNDHACKLPEGFPYNETSLPIVDDGFGLLRLAQCERYVNPIGEGPTVDCDDGYVYDTGEFNENGTIVMEWDLVCKDGASVETSQTIFNVGVVLGFFLFTPWGDRFGRKKVFFICSFFMNVFGVALSFAPNFTAFCVFQFLTGACGAGLLMTGTVLALEMFPADLREFLAPATSLFLTLGMVTLPIWAVIFRDWRNLQLSISIAGFIPMIYVFWCPESLRWLVVNFRWKEVNSIIARAAKFNNITDLPPNPLGPPDAEEEEREERETNSCSNKCSEFFCPSTGKGEQSKSEFVPFMKSSRPRRYFIIMMYLVFTDNIMYFGLSLLMGSLDTLNVFLNFFINSIIEVPGIIASIVAMAFFGRRRPLIFFHIWAGISMAICGICSVVPMSDDWEEAGVRIDLIAAFAFISKFGVAASWCVVLVYAQEIFPTNMRNTGLGMVSGAGYIGNIIAPYAVLLFRINALIPTLIFAGMSAIAGAVTAFVPETMGRDLPSSVEEVASWPMNLSPEEQAQLRKNRRRLSAAPVTIQADLSKFNSTNSLKASNYYNVPDKKKSALEMRDSGIVQENSNANSPEGTDNEAFERF